MTDRLFFIEHHGHKIMWCDYSRLSPGSMISLLEEASALGMKEGKELNILADFSKTPQSKEFNALIKQRGKAYYKAGIDVKVAVLGIDSPLKRVIVNGTMAISKIRNVKLFQGKETAMNWLVKEVVLEE